MIDFSTNYQTTVKISLLLKNMKWIIRDHMYNNPGDINAWCTFTIILLVTYAKWQSSKNAKIFFNLIISGPQGYLLKSRPHPKTGQIAIW